MRSFDVISAADLDLGIGKDGDLPWKLRSEMRHFSRTTKRTEDATKRNAVFMGRVNWEATPEKYRPLPGRLNVVLTRREDYPLPDGVLRANSIEDALRQLAEPPYDREIERVFCIGGGNVYAQAMAMPQCTRLVLTRIDERYGCDTFFPAHAEDFELTEVLGRGSDGDVDYEIQDWRRRAV
ncbi:MAG: dihydrofolate reductase [Proteobacteria bacterium]|nr:dihydrofolate reductase [Pseudomonadota bacterium]